MNIDISYCRTRAADIQFKTATVTYCGLYNNPNCPKICDFAREQEGKLAKLTAKKR